MKLRDLPTLRVNLSFEADILSCSFCISTVEDLSRFIEMLKPYETLLIEAASRRLQDEQDAAKKNKPSIKDAGKLSKNFGKDSKAGDKPQFPAYGTNDPVQVDS